MDPLRVLVEFPAGWQGGWWLTGYVASADESEDFQRCVVVEEHGQRRRIVGAHPACVRVASEEGR